MTLERGDSPLAGRRPAPLRSVAALSAMNSMNSMSSMNGVGQGHAPVQSSSLGSLGTLGPMSSLGSMGPVGKSGSVSSQSVSSSAPPPGASLGQNASIDGRANASFWLELKGVERWFDTLEPHERVTLMASLFARSPEPQLHQFSSTIDKALRNQPGSAAAATNLSRFGVGQKHGQNTDMASVYRYRSPLSAGATAGPVGQAPAASNSGNAGAPGTAAGNDGPGMGANTGANAGSNLGSNLAANAGSNAGPGSNASSSAPPASTAPGPAKTPSSVRAGPSGPNHATAPAEQGSSAGYVSPLAFPSSTTHGTDLYSQAFLPLPRTQSYGQGYSPWGTEIRRPNSAAADAWPDTTRSSPTLQSATSNTGSPTISNLSLDNTPLPFASVAGNSSASVSASATSPIGHPLKPWRTFTPHQNPIGSGIGLAPDSNAPKRQHPLPHAASMSHSSPSSPPSASPASSRSSATAAALAPGSVPLSTVTSSTSQPNLLDSSTHHASDDSSSSSNDSVSGREPAAGSSSNPGMSTGVSTGSHTGSVGNSVGNSVGSSVGSSVGNSRTGSTTPKDNRMARRTVNIVDVELLSDIGAWLRSLRLHKYTGNLSGMKWQDVIQLTDQDLEDRGVNALGARRKLLKMFEEIRMAQEAGQLPDQ